MCLFLHRLDEHPAKLQDRPSKGVDPASNLAQMLPPQEIFLQVPPSSVPFSDSTLIDYFCHIYHFLKLFSPLPEFKLSISPIQQATSISHLYYCNSLPASFLVFLLSIHAIAKVIL